MARWADFAEPESAGLAASLSLCPSSCDTVRPDHAGRIDVVFGGATDGNLIP